MKQRSRLLWAVIYVLTLSPHLYAQNLARPNIEGPAGLEVNSYSGNLFYSKSLYSIPGKGPEMGLALNFTYNSHKTSLDFGYGNGWTSAQNMLYEVQGADILVRHIDGSSDLYTWTGSSFQAPTGVYDKLEQYSPGKYRLSTLTGMKFNFDDQSHKRLSSVSDRNNNTQTISYSAGKPQSITDGCGRSLNFTYSGGRLTQIVDNNTSPARTSNISYDAFGNMRSISDPNGGTTTFTYDAGRNLIQVQDARSSIFDISYNASGQVTGISSAISNMSFAYANPITTITEIGSVSNRTTTYTFDGQGRLTQISGACCGQSNSFTYDSQNNIVSASDANANTTLYTYDNLGNVTSTTDALNNVTTVTYEANSRRVASETDNNGNTTSYEYDGNGNLTKITRPLSVIETFTHNSSGDVTSQSDGEGVTVTRSYDACGNLTAINPGVGGVSRTYDNVGNMLTETDALNNTVSYSYDAMNQELSRTSALACVEYSAYDNNGNIAAEIDANGNQTLYSYDILDRETKVTRELEVVYELVYNEFGEEMQRIDPMGNNTDFTYDAVGNLTSITNAMGKTMSFTHDPVGRVLTETGYDGATSTFQYDAIGWIVSATDALNNTTTFDYDKNGNRTEQTNAANTKTTSTFDALNRLTKVNRAGTDVSRITYNKSGMPTSVQDATNRTFTYNYDANGRLTQVDGPIGFNVQFTYDPVGRITQYDDANGNPNTYTYDNDGRLQVFSNGEGEPTVYTYDCVGNQTGELEPGGNLIVRSFDALNRPISVSDNFGTISTSAYNKNSMPVSQTNAMNQTTQFSYDPLNRLTVVTDPLAKTLQRTYDDASNVTGITDRNSLSYSYTFDALKRMTSATDPDGNTINISYDAVGNVTSRTDPDNNTTSMTYDAHGRVILETFADATTRSYTYNGLGQMLSATDASGATTHLSYDALGRLESRDYPGINDDVFTYDLGGRLLSAVNNDATVTFGYDQADRTIVETLNGLSTSINFDVYNRIKTISYPSGRTIPIHADQRIRPAEFREGGVLFAAQSFSSSDDVTAISYPLNGTNMARGYNQAGGITGVNHDPLAFVNFQYTLDCESQRSYTVKGHRPTHSESYTLNAANRIVNFKTGTDNGGTIFPVLNNSDFTYTSGGDRINRTDNGVVNTYTSNNMHAYTTIVENGIPRNPIYDVNGMRTSDGINSYGYNGAGRMSTVNGGATAAYKYDALGRRIEKQLISGTTKYYYLNDDVIEERDGGGAVLATYVHGTESDELISMRRAGQDYYYHADALGSIAAMTDASGNVVERYEYDVYGTVSIFDAAFNARTNSVIDNPYMFAGRRFDAETGLYYNRMRYYDPQDGRFTRRDPIGIWGDPANTGNAYAYADNQPVDYTDPSGLLGGRCRNLGNRVIQAIRNIGNHLENRFKAMFRRPGIVNVDEHCPGTWPFPRTVRLKFNKCDEMQRTKVRAAICGVLKVAAYGAVEVSDYMEGKGTQAQQEETLQRLKNWFGLSKDQNVARLQIKIVCQRLSAVLKAFEKKIKFKCKTNKGICSSGEAWWLPSSGVIRLCRRFFDDIRANGLPKDDKFRTMTIYHELVHKQTGALDHGYLRIDGNPFSGYSRQRFYFAGPWVSVGPKGWQKRHNASTYENFVYKHY